MAPPSKRKYTETGYRGGWTLPGYPHCGPFNEVSDQPSTGLDEVCRQHDLEYGKLGSAAYFRYNKAHARFREQAADISRPATRLTSGIWAITSSALLLILILIIIKKCLKKQVVVDGTINSQKNQESVQTKGMQPTIELT